MKKMLLFCAFFLSINSFSQTTITKSIGDFNELKVYNGIKVELIQSEDQKLVITGEKAEKVKVKNSNGKLRLSLKFPEVSAEGKVKISVHHNKDIQIIDGNEGATITGKIDQFQLEVKSQEGADIKLEVKTKHLKVKASSGGIIELSGNTKNQEVDADLKGIYHGFQLMASDNTTARAGSGAKVELQSGETLNVKVTFGGSIFYKGNPEVIKDKKVMGGIIKQVQ